ncbi:uncharacterized protein LOC142323184 isoform X2 [Lycorma delicatula]|uniref:uncharacterized protein LOC142323184 isoform X2 n=1 Tax=Lycorma delicatula TaxID=130591 RepID=UPI003F51A273
MTDCLKILFANSLLAISVNSFEYLAPYCVAQINNVSFTCTISETNTVYSEEYWTSDCCATTLNHYDSVEPVAQYVNTSAPFFTTENMEWKLMVYGDGLEAVWSIKLTSIILNDNCLLNNLSTTEKCLDLSDNDEDNFGMLLISNIPISKYYNHIKINKCFKNSDLANEAEPELCNERRTENECNILKNAIITLHNHSPQSLIILNINASSKINLNIHTMQADCFVNCSGTWSNCSVSNNDYLWLGVDGNSNTMYKFENIQPSYFCVAPVENECCIVGTPTVQIEGPVLQAVLHTETWQAKEKEFKEMVVMGLLLVFAVVIFWIVVKVPKYKPLHSQKSLENNSRTENAIEESLDCEKTCDQAIREPVKVFLIYSRESEEFMSQIERLTEDLVRNHSVQVFDPLSPSNYMEVSMNPARWLQLHMNKPNMKFILVAHEQAILREKAWLKDQKLILENQHYLDDVFLCALSSLYNNPKLINNYSRLFIISFGSDLSCTDDCSYFKSLVQTRFNLWNQYERLLYELLQ